MLTPDAYEKSQLLSGDNLQQICGCAGLLFGSVPCHLVSNAIKDLYHCNWCAQETVVVDALLVAAGRSPNVSGLGLEAAGVDYDINEGIKVTCIVVP